METFATVVLVLLSIRYVDRPLAHWLAHFPALKAIFASAPVQFPLLLVLAGAAVIGGVGLRLLGWSRPRWMMVAQIAGVALVLSVVVTEWGLKPLFGRTLPRAYLSRGDYGFHWFHAGDAFGSLPSGHSDQAAAILSVLWVHYPAWRPLYAALFILLSLALMAGQWHYLSDVIAGAYVGTVAGAVTIALHRAWARRRHRTPLPTLTIA